MEDREFLKKITKLQVTSAALYVFPTIFIAIGLIFIFQIDYQPDIDFVSLLEKSILGISICVLGILLVPFFIYLIRRRIDKL